MSLRYRAIWQDDRADLEEIVRDEFRQWVLEKHSSIGQIGEERIERRVADEDVIVETRLTSDGGLRGLQAVLVEDRGRERWMTRVRVISDLDVPERWIWVDLERTADDPFQSSDVAAPRLVRSLIETSLTNGGRPSIGPAPLSVRAFAVRDAELSSKVLDLLENPLRTSPMVLFSHRKSEDPAKTMLRAQAAAEILAGVATVLTLPPDAQQQFQDHVGRALSVWGGAARMYLPGALLPTRHRYLDYSVVSRHPREAGRRFAQMLSSSISAQRAPELYERVRPLLRGTASKDVEELLEIAESEVHDRNHKIDELRTELEEQRNLWIDAQADVEAIQQELLGERRRLRSLLYADGDDDSGWAIPDEATSLTDAAHLCTEHLDGVVLPPEACRELDLLDQALEADSWARSAWLGMRALDAYAREAPEFNGGFWEWCKSTDSVDRWSATDKRLAMSESKTVMQTPRLRDRRLLPISAAIDESGFTIMEAHLKIAEGGGPQAPRIYFYDDTGGSTGKIHIGFFGPHRFMPNTRTN